MHNLHLNVDFCCTARLWNLVSHIKERTQDYSSWSWRQYSSPTRWYPTT